MSKKRQKVFPCDIAPRQKRTEAALRALDNHYRLLVQNSPDVILIVDRHGTILFINRTFPQHTVESVIGTDATRCLTLKDGPRFKTLLKKMFDAGEPLQLELESISSKRWLVRIFPIQHDEDLESALVIATNITEQKGTERALLESNDLNRRIIEAVPAGIVQVATDGAIRMANGHAQRILGLRLDELTKLYVADFDTKTIWEDGTPCEPKDYPVSKCLATGKPQPGVILGVRRRDGQTSWGIFSAIPMRDPKSGTLSGTMVTFIDITEQKRTEVELENSRQQLRDLSTHLQTILEEERTRLSREIHDELGQQLTILKMELAWLRKQLPRKENLLRQRTQSMTKLVDATIRGVRKISAEMRPVVLDDLGLTAAMEWQVEEFKNRTGLRCQFTARPEEITLDRDRSTTVFRIFQETLTNIIRHAHADEIQVRLEKVEDHLCLEVRDNGRGITEGQIANSKSLGLLGIRERARLWGGTVNIQGAPGKGTTLSVQIPLYPSGGEEKERIGS